jgi:hypothetical protein
VHRVRLMRANIIVTYRALLVLILRKGVAGLLTEAGGNDGVVAVQQHEIIVLLVALQWLLCEPRELA